VFKEVAETKYGKYVINEIAEKKGVFKPFYPRILFDGYKYADGIKMCLAYNCLSEPLVMLDKPHSHEFEQFFCLFGADGKNLMEFDAEIELYLGDEGEKHYINSPTMVYIPKGLKHGPLNFKRIGKPIIFIDYFPVSEYTRKGQPDFKFKKPE
jgi:hypothetical protein